MPKYTRIAEIFALFEEIGVEVEERDGDVRFQTGSGNTAVSRMRNKEYAIILFMAESPKFPPLGANRGRGT